MVTARVTAEIGEHGRVDHHETVGAEIAGGRADVAPDVMAAGSGLGGRGDRHGEGERAASGERPEGHGSRRRPALGQAQRGGAGERRRVDVDEGEVQRPGRPRRGGRVKLPAHHRRQPVGQHHRTAFGRRHGERVAVALLRAAHRQELALQGPGVGGGDRADLLDVQRDHGVLMHRHVDQVHHRAALAVRGVAEPAADRAAERRVLVHPARCIPASAFGRPP